MRGGARDDDSSRPSATDLAHVRDRYLERIAVHGVSSASMNSGTPEKQALRHRVHLELVQPGWSVLDVGCGVGEMLAAMRTLGLRGRYVGVDIVREYVEHCRRHFPDEHFELVNVFDEGIPGEVDVVVASQVFNARYPGADNAAVVRRFLDLAFAAARRAVSVDMLSSYVDFTAPELHYFSPEAMFQHAKTLTRLVRLRHDYLPFEFAVQLLRETPGPPAPESGR